MLIIDRMKNVKLTQVERLIADYILEHLDVVEKLSTRDIASNVYVSTSAVIRLANKLGYSGYKELKQQLIQELEYVNSHFSDIDANIPFNETNTMMNTASIIKELACESLNDTLSLLSHDSLQKAVSMLHKADTIGFFGYSAYEKLGHVFKMKMNRIHRKVAVCDTIGEQKYHADILSDKDCVIMVSYSGENANLLYVAKLLKEKHIPIIVITSLGHNSMVDLADVVLLVTTREKIYSKIASFSVEYSVSLLLDILYSCIFRLDYKKNLEYKVSHSKKYEYTHFSSNEILKED